MLKGIEDLASLHPSSEIFSSIKPNVEESFQNLIMREQSKNMSLMESFMKVKKELTKEKVEREALECKHYEMEERLKVIQEANDRYNQLKAQYQKGEQERKKYVDQIDWLRGREEEIIKRMDLDEIDLMTERLAIYGVEARNISPKAPKRNPKIPKLDLEKVQLLKDQDEEDYEEEEEEEEVKSSQKQFLYDGSVVVSNDSGDRLRELQSRKEQVIALLNQTYGDEGAND